MNKTGGKPDPTVGKHSSLYFTPKKYNAST